VTRVGWIGSTFENQNSYNKLAKYLPIIDKSSNLLRISTIAILIPIHLAIIFVPLEVSEHQPFVSLTRLVHLCGGLFQIYTKLRSDTRRIFLINGLSMRLQSQEGRLNVDNYRAYNVKTLQIQRNPTWHQGLTPSSSTSPGENTNAHLYSAQRGPREHRKKHHQDCTSRPVWGHGYVCLGLWIMGSAGQSFSDI
jgi:hypothetical protein